MSQPYFHVEISLIYFLPVIGMCAMANGNCSDICTDQNGSAICSCTSGFRLGTDNKTCSGEKHDRYCTVDLWLICFRYK